MSDLKEFFIRALKEQDIQLSPEEEVKAFNKFVYWANGMAAEYFNSPYYRGGDNETEGNN